LRDILSALIFDAKWLVVYCQLKSACPLCILKHKKPLFHYFTHVS
jgi:hypothetical protein